MLTSESAAHEDIKRWSETFSGEVLDETVVDLRRSTLDLGSTDLTPIDLTTARVSSSAVKTNLINLMRPQSAQPPHSGEVSMLMTTLNHPSRTPSPESRGFDSRFSVDQTIGEGSFGTVWSVTDRELKRSVAVKTFKGECERATQAYKDETRLAGRLDHPGIPTVYDVGISDDGQPFMVMKLLQGESLYDIITRLAMGDEETHQRYSFIRRVELLIQLLRILMKVHQDGVIHRDIKPENILISPEGALFLLDWGCATELGDVSEESTPCGTPTFMPPEQVLGRALSPASDLFAFAGVAYEFLCLHPPIPMDGSLIDTLKLVLTHQPKAVDLIPHPTQGYVPSEFSAIIMSALARAPADRPQSASEILETLQRALEGHIDIVCPRTRIKAYTARFMRALDRNPYRVVPLFYMTLGGVVLVLIALGALLGALLT